MRVTLVTALSVTLSLTVTSAQLQPQTVGRETMSEPGENWFISKTQMGAYIYDGMTGEMQGLLSLSNYTPAVEPYAPRQEFYAAESYYSRGVYGVRTDIVAIYDFANLSPVAEVEIPKKIAVLPLRGHIGLMGNGRHLAIFNMTPAQSITIVDVEARTFVGEISTPGCAMIMPVADNDFLMICGDGTLQLLQLDDDGNESNRVRSGQAFVVEDDPVFDRPVPTSDGWLLVSHRGKALDVSTDGARIEISDAWSIVTDEDVEERWRPGGRQLKDVHKNSGFLYVLMHQGGEDTHHEPGTEVWMIDVGARRRVARLELAVAASHIMVTQEAEPKLIVSDEEGRLHLYDAFKLTLDRTIEDPGPEAALLEDF